MNIFTYFRKNYLNLIGFVLTIGIAIAYLCVAHYALPKTDDFANFQSTVASFNETGDASKTAWDLMTRTYMNQQGTFFSLLVIMFLFAKIGMNFVTYRYVIEFFTVFFFVAFIFMLYVMSKYFKFNKAWGVFLLGALWIAVDRIGPGEFMMYLTGMAVYSLPMALAFFSIGFFLLCLNANRRLIAVIFALFSSGCAFLACGGVLMVSAMTNMLMVLFILHRWYTTKQFPFRGIVPFLFAFASALINALAPGNFNRYTGETGISDTKMQVWDSIVHTFGITNQEIGKVISHTFFLIAILFIAAFILIPKWELSKDDYKVHPLFFLLGGYALSYIVIFPTVLGYNMAPGDYIQERLIYAMSVVIALSLIIFWTYLMFWMKAGHSIALSKSKLAVAGYMGLLLIGLIVNIYYVPIVRDEQCKPTLAQIHQEFSTGSIYEYYAAHHLTFLLAMNTRPDTAFHIYYWFPESHLFTYSSFSADPNWWVNSTAAATFDVPIFAYVPDHDFTEQDALDAECTIESLLP